MAYLSDVAQQEVDPGSGGYRQMFSFILRAVNQKIPATIRRLDDGCPRDEAGMPLAYRANRGEMVGLCSIAQEANPL